MQHAMELVHPHVLPLTQKLWPRSGARTAGVSVSVVCVVVCCCVLCVVLCAACRCARIPQTQTG